MKRDDVGFTVLRFFVLLFFLLVNPVTVGYLGYITAEKLSDFGCILVIICSLVMMIILTVCADDFEADLFRKWIILCLIVGVVTIIVRAGVINGSWRYLGDISIWRK